MIDKSAMPLYITAIASRDGEYSMSETEVTTASGDTVAEAMQNVVVALKDVAFTADGPMGGFAYKFKDKVAKLQADWAAGPKAGGTGAKRGRKPKAVAEAAE